MSLRKLPALTAENTAFWTGGKQGQLLIQYCSSCKRYQHPPLGACPQCGGETSAKAVSGRGQVGSFTVNHHPWVPGQAVPFVLAYIELEEQPGLYVVSNVTDCDPDTVCTGMAVEVHFETQVDIALPLFRPRGEA